MKLNQPFIIASNLCPGLQIAGATITLEPSNWPTVFSYDSYGKPRWRYEITLPDGERYDGDDLYGWGGTQEMFRTLLAFLGACAESRRHRERMGYTDVDEDSDEGLFHPAVAEWAAQNSDEISCMQCEIEETKNLIEE